MYSDNADWIQLLAGRGMALSIAFALLVLGGTLVSELGGLSARP